MSEMSVRLFAPLCLLLVLAVLGGIGFAAASTPSAITDIVATPAVPEMLGPIEEGGRVGWACVPERMAEAKTWKAAHLPTELTR